MTSKLYGYVDTNDIYTPYNFKNCSKNGCTTKHYLGFTISYSEQGYCGSCNRGIAWNDNDEVVGSRRTIPVPVTYLPVSFRGDKFDDGPNNCCNSSAEIPLVSFIDSYIDIDGKQVWEYDFEKQRQATKNCYLLANSINDPVPMDIATPIYSEEALAKTLNSKVCTNPDDFQCSPTDIVWLRNFPTTSLTNELRTLLFPYFNLYNWPKIFNKEIPDTDIELDFSAHIYPYNFQIGCDMTIMMNTEVYQSELEIDLVIPDFISAAHSVPSDNVGNEPFLCIKNPIFGNGGSRPGEGGLAGGVYYHDGACNVPVFPCQKQLNPMIIWDYKTGEYQEPIGCCYGPPQENYCCNSDFIDKIRTLEDYECFEIETNVRKFIGQTKNRDPYIKDKIEVFQPGDIDIHCNLNTITDQFYRYEAKIPVCVASPDFMTVNTYDVVVQGYCDADPVPSGTGSEFCPPFTIDPDDICISLKLTYNKQIPVVPKLAVKLTYYYCEVTYTECQS